MHKASTYHYDQWGFTVPHKPCDKPGWVYHSTKGYRKSSVRKDWDVAKPTSLSSTHRPVNYFTRVMDKARRLVNTLSTSRFIQNRGGHRGG